MPVKPVDQTKFVEVDGHGDCYRACIASILELPSEEVPDFRVAHDMDSAIDAFLQSRSFRRITLQFCEHSDRDIIITDDLWHPVGNCHLESPPAILCGLSPRGDGKRRHAVVGRVKGWRVMHDPHPSRAGIVGPPYRIDWIVPHKYEW